MARRQTFLAGTTPLLTLEEAYWQVMSKLTEVDDFVYEHKTAGFITQEQRSKAENLYRTLMDRNMDLDLIWRSETDIDKFCNTHEWVQIIAGEASATLAAIRDVISLPGTFPRPCQTETQGHHTSPPPGSFPRQHQTETFGTRSGDNLVTSTVWRTLVYSDDQTHKYANQKHSPLAETRPSHPTKVICDQTPDDDQTAQNSADQKSSNNNESSRTIPHLMDIHIQITSPSPYKHYNTSRAYQPSGRGFAIPCGVRGDFR